MGHDHEHNHTHGANKKTLFICFIIITAYMIVEATGGFITNSLALLSDAGHMLSDAISLGITLLAFKYSEQVANYSKTYGYKRFEIIAAVINGVTLVLIAIYIFYEAIQRFQKPPEIASAGMLTIAIIGLIINILVATIMIRGGDVEENLNMRGAYLHVISDILGSVGAIIAALLIMFFGWSWADPVASIIVAVLVLRSGYFIMKSAINVLMEGTPPNVDVKDVIHYFQNIKEIHSIHDLHVWSITSGLNVLTCHAVVDEQMSVVQCEKLILLIKQELEHKNIHHLTIQFETNSHQLNNVFCNKLPNTSGHH